jgi:DNA helicase IV
MPQGELAREREYVGALYDRLDVLREEAQQQLEGVRRGSPGGTHQARSERDAFARMFEDRLRQLRAVDERLAFGRLEFAADGEESPYRYIGRIGLRDEQQHPLLLDWRVPQARAFYQATAANPLGARARRHLLSRGRDVVRIDDEVFDEELLDGDASSLQGEAALMATLTARRTGRMGDIVATIQAEQDAIIRSELHGALVVQGGPGTGKTAVALHRAAYLLYTHRERLAASGVLVVGPSRSFLHYIESVLPSLGETGVVLASLGQLFPGVEATEEDEPATARIKGSLEMAELLRRAVRSRQVVPEHDQTVEVSGETLTIPAQLIRQAMHRAQESGKPHNIARAAFNRSALTALGQLLAEQLRSNGNTIEESDQSWLREDLRTAYDVKVALNTAWMPLTPQKLLQDLYARPQWLASLTPDWTAAQRGRLRRERDAPFTISDVALLDEAAELLGRLDPAEGARARERKAQRKRDLENAEQAIRNMEVEGLVDAKTLAAGFEEQADFGSTAERAANDREWAFGHVVVDEAQDLSAMQWRVLVRRNPLRSFTIVGDVAQSSTASGATSWEEALRPHLGDNWRLAELSVNYRTPAQVAEVAEAMAIEHGVTITRSRAVREGDHPVSIDRAADAVAAAVDAVASEQENDDRGTVAVIAPESLAVVMHAALVERFGDLVGRGEDALARPIAALSPRESKGLEFDVVVVAEPQLVIDEHERGAAALYVAMTRATQRLHLVTSRDLPAGIAG